MAGNSSSALVPIAPAWGRSSCRPLFLFFSLFLPNPPVLSPILPFFTTPRSPFTRRPALSFVFSLHTSALFVLLVLSSPPHTLNPLQKKPNNSTVYEDAPCPTHPHRYHHNLRKPCSSLLTDGDRGETDSGIKAVWLPPLPEIYLKISSD